MAMSNYINPYNPYMTNFMQNRMDSLQRQRADIDNQISMMNQQMQNQQPPIQQTFITNPQPQETQNMQFDFRGKWVSNKDEAKNIANSNLPLILLDGNESKFYMKDTQGGLRTFRFEEVFENDSNDKQSEEIEMLKNQLNQQNQAIQAILATLTANANTNTRIDQTVTERSETVKKQAPKSKQITKEETTNG